MSKHRKAQRRASFRRHCMGGLFGSSPFVAEMKRLMDEAMRHCRTMDVRWPLHRPPVTVYTDAAGGAWNPGNAQFVSTPQRPK